MTAENPTARDDAMAQIARLRDRVDALMREKALPAMENLTAQAETSAREAAAWSREHAESARGVVRAQPLAAVLIAAAVGFVLGRAVR